MQRLYTTLTLRPLFKLSTSFTSDAFRCLNDFASDSVVGVGQIFRQVEVVNLWKVTHLDSHFTRLQELKQNFLYEVSKYLSDSRFLCVYRAWQ